MHEPQTVDVGKLLDGGHWSSRQKFFVFLTALTIVFDGIDNQLLGIAIPAMMRDWAVRARRVRSRDRERHDRHDARRRAGRRHRRPHGPAHRPHRQRGDLRRAHGRGLPRRQPLCPRRPAAPRRSRPRRRHAQRRGAGLRVRPAPAPATRHHADHRLRAARRDARRVGRRIPHPDLRLANPLRTRRRALPGCRRRSHALSARVAPLPRTASTPVGRARAHPPSNRPRRACGQPLRRSRRKGRGARIRQRVVHARFPP